MRNKILLPILLLATFVLGACTPGGDAKKSSEEAGASSEVDTTEYGVAIANKEALQGDWFVGSSQDLDITLTPAANPLAELGKNLTVTSSDPETVAVTGLGLSALKAGNAKITVQYHSASDEVDVVILENTPQGKYGVEHDGTAESPFTNEEALLAAKSPRYAGEDYYVKGIVDSFYHAPGSRDDGACSFFLKPAQEGGERFEIYKCYKEGSGAASYLTADDIWKGGEVLAHGKFTVYNGQYETSSATFVSCTGNKPQPPQTLEKTFAEALALGVALKDGDDSYDYIKFQGYVSKKSGNDYYLTATKGEALVSGKSDATHGERDIYTNAIELYGAAKVEALAAKLLENAKNEVTMVLKNYHGTVENGNTLADADVTVVEAGTPWAVPEPEVKTRTLKEFIDGENVKTAAYLVTGTIKAFKTGATKDEYGNMTLTDGTNDLIIYGSSITETALAWDNSSAYAFTNPKDFLAKPETVALQVGNTITMKLIRADYIKGETHTIEGTGVITNIVAVATTAVALDKATAEVEVGSSLNLVATRTPENSNSPIVWSSSDETKATVDATGKVTGVAAGEATITAKISDEIKAQCVVTVKTPAPVEGTVYTIDVSDSAWPTAAEDAATAHTIGTVALKTCGLNKDTSSSAQAGGDIFMKKGAGYLFNTTSLGKILSIKVTFSGNSSAGKYANIVLGSSAIEARNTDSANAYTFAKGETVEVKNTKDGVGYFNISNNQSSSGKNIRIVKIVITCAE